MKKYIIAPERDRFSEVSASNAEMAYRGVCCWYNPGRRVAVIDAETMETVIFTRTLDENGNLSEVRRWKA